MIRTLLRCSLVLALLTPVCSLPAQGLAGVQNADKGVMFYLGYGPFVSAGDLADRFENGWAMDGGVSYLLKSSAWEFGLRAQYGFGSNVREDVLAGLRTADGFVIGNQRNPANLQLRQRQLFVGPTLGYTFQVGDNPRAGFHLKTSVGYFYHRIRIQDDPSQGVEPLQPEKKGGYDRLTGGLAIHQFIGYQQLSIDNVLNFYIGADVTAGFTTALRSYDVPTGSVPSDAGRLDLVLGLRAGVIVPIYRGEGREIYYR